MRQRVCTRGESYPCDRLFKLKYGIDISVNHGCIISQSQSEVSHELPVGSGKISLLDIIAAIWQTKITLTDLKYQHP